VNLKDLDYRYIPVHLTRDGGVQFAADFLQVNPQALVPVLEENGAIVSQSLAILEYLDETYPAVRLLPEDSLDRAFVRSIALSIACEIHPLNNLRVLKYLTETLGLAETAKNEWIHHWISTGLNAVESQLRRRQQGKFCFGNQPTVADCCLIPQLFNARRFKVDLTSYPLLLSIETHCNEIDAFRRAHPDLQPDSE
jgi:maleylpyruvate isomerase